MLVNKHPKRMLIAASFLALASVFSLGQAQTAQANQPNDSWSTNQKVGYCGATTGGYVLAAQNFLYGGEGYTPMDAQFGANTNAATRTFQSQVGITVDGCIGPQSWSVMRAQLVSQCSPGYSCSVTNFASHFNGGTVYYDRTNCDWGTYTDGEPVGGSVQNNAIYSFAASLTGVVSCA
jgi:hypothetical protein